MRDYIYVEHFTSRETKGGGVYGWALRSGEYKSVNPIDEAAELYNLAEDPLEQNNLLADGGTKEMQTIQTELYAIRENLLAIEQ